MSRTIPWRNKPTPLISQMIPIAKELKLYLVHQIGPTNLVLKDQNDNKFKIIIGDTINCSCNVVKNDHCIHSLFVMLKKFKVSENHPILWQASYLDSELDGMTQHKYQQSIQSKTKITAKQFLKRKKEIKTQEEEDFPPLDEEEVCPICYEEMNGQCYSSCQTCHKNFHTKCFKVWTKHKEDSQSPVTCPMCRNKFVNPTKIIYRDLQRWENIFSTHKGSHCKCCGQKNIKGLIYKCLTCSNADLCKLCYEGNQHLEHDLFCVKQLSSDKWKLAPIRAKKTRKQLFQPIDQIDLKQLPALESPEFILCLLPTIKQFNAKQAKSQLGIVGNQMKSVCTKCHTQGNQSMIRLNCSHPIHSECLLSIIEKKQYCCEIDNEIICPGYWAALEIKVVKSTKKSSTNVNFMRNHEQTQILQKKNALNSLFEPKNSKQQRKIFTQTKKQLSIGIKTGVGKQLLMKTEKQFSIVSGKQVVGGINRISGMKPKELKGLRASSMNKKSSFERKQQIQSLAVGGFGMKYASNTNTMEFLNYQGINQMNNDITGQLLSGHNIGLVNNKIPPKPRMLSNKNNTYAQKLG